MLQRTHCAPITVTKSESNADELISRHKLHSLSYLLFSSLLFYSSIRCVLVYVLHCILLSLSFSFLSPFFSVSVSVSVVTFLLHLSCQPERGIDSCVSLAFSLSLSLSLSLSIAGGDKKFSRFLHSHSQTFLYLGSAGHTPLQVNIRRMRKRERERPMRESEIEAGFRSHKA